MPPKPHTKHLFYQLGYTAWAFSLLSHLSHMLGRRLSAIIGEVAGRFYTATHSHVTEVMEKNLEILMGRKVSKNEAGQVFVNFGVTMADYIWLATQPKKSALHLAELENVKITCNEGCGAILATGHYGFFEYGAVVLQLMGFPVSVVTYAEPTPALTKWRADYRRRWGTETIELGSDAFSSLRAVEAIQSGRLTAMLVDRPLGNKSIDVKMPGGDVAFSASPAILSWITGCPIVPVTIRRMSSGKYIVRAGSPIYTDRTQSRDTAISTCTKQIADALISDFREDPLQWYHFVPLTRVS